MSPPSKTEIDQRDTLMSEQNIVNITDANLQQTLQQSMNAPVLFYFWSARSQHC